MNANPAHARENPYVGPWPLEIRQPIYGRDREILEITDLLIYKRFVLLHAPSGAGKTSLIQAGLVPALEKQGFRVALPLLRVGLEPPQDFIPAGHAYNRYLLSTYISLESAFPEDMRTPLATLASQDLQKYLCAAPAEVAGAQA